MPNTVDSEFLRLTIPHHEQGVKMGELAAERGSMPDLKQMAESMAADQRQEIGELEGMLPAAGLAREDVKPDPSVAAGMSQLLDHLGQLSGHQFDQSFLAVMTNHHMGAIQMAEVELAAGEFDDLKEMARSAHQKQTKEVREMGSMLVQMGSGDGMISKAKEALS